MKRAVSISLGSSERDKQVEIELLGEKVLIERRGTDGDTEKATRLFNELDGKVDALGLGGIDLYVQIYDKKWPIHAAHRLVTGVKQTPLVDGGGLKNTLERQVVAALIEQLGDRYASGRVLLTAAVDRFGMTLAFFEQNYEVICGDVGFALGMGIPVRTMTQLKWFANILAPIATRLPISVLYPTGEKQREIVPKFTNWYEWATVIAGDAHYIRRHMPADLSGKVIVTNTTTPKDMALFAERGVKHVMTTTPVLDGRSFGTNMMEAALTAVADKKRPLTHDELNGMIRELGLRPTLHTV